MTDTSIRFIRRHAETSGALTLLSNSARTLPTSPGFHLEAPPLSPILTPVPQPKADRANVSAQYGKLPLVFEANRGQADSRVKFLSRGNGYSVFLTGKEAVVALKKAASGSNAAASASAIQMQLVGASKSVQPSAIEELPGKSNYFLGNDPQEWRTNVPIYAKVKYQGVYPGVDLVYYGNQHQLEYDFVVAPEADASAIHLKFTGAGELRLSANGDLLLGSTAESGSKEIRFLKPTVYQWLGEAKKPVEGNYLLVSSNTLSFQIGDYDHSKPLVIDPVLSYSTYLGGSAGDYGQGIAVDNSGNAYITGRTFSSDFPVANNLQSAPANSSLSEVFVTKINTAGSAIVYSTYLGGSNSDLGQAIAVDTMGNAYVAGFTSSTNFPTVNALQSKLAGVKNAFVTKLNPDGSALIYSTYLGGSVTDEAFGIASDSLGNAYVAGFTQSRNFPVSNALQPRYGGGKANAFVSKINPDGSALVYSTFLGGSGYDQANGIALDLGGNAYVTGFTNSRNFPTLNAFQYTLGSANSYNAFVTEVNAEGNGVVYSTYLGGNGNDYGQSIAVDMFGNAYVAGSTSSANFPVFRAMQPQMGGQGTNVFVTEINAGGSSMTYSTFLGGNGNDAGYGIAVDIMGNVYVTGSVGSSNFPLVDSSENPANTSGNAFVSKLSPDGSTLVYSSVIGGTQASYGQAIAVDPLQNAYVTGYTQATDFPLTNALQPAFGGGSDDAFVAKISKVVGDFAGTFNHGTANATPSVPATYVLTVAPLQGFTADVTLSASGLPSGAVATFSPATITGGSGTSTITVSVTSAVPPGNYPFTVTGSTLDFSHSTTIDLLVDSVDFTGSVTPTFQAVATGGSTQYTISLQTLGTQPFGSSVALSVAGLPAGVTATFNPASLNPDAKGSSLLTLATSGATPEGTYTLVLTGTGGGQSHSTNITLAVSAPATVGDFTGSFDCTAYSTNQGGQASYNLTVIPLGGFNGDVALTVSNLPPASTGGFTPSVVPGGSGLSTLTINVDPTTPIGIYTITVTGSSGSALVHSTTLTLLVGQVDFSGTVTPPSQTVPAGGSALYTISLWTVGTMPFNNNVTLFVSSLPPGVTAGFSTVVVSPDADGASVLTLTTSASTPPGAYSVVVSGTGGGVSHSRTIGLTVVPPSPNVVRAQSSHVEKQSARDYDY